MTQSIAKSRDELSCGLVLVKKEVGGVLYLLVQEAKGHWSFPKGHKESLESDEECARRELLEETGLSDISVTPDAVFSCDYPIQKNGVEINKTVRCLLAVLNSGEAKIQKDFEEEILDIKWLSFDEAKAHLGFRATTKILEEANAYILKNF